MFDREKLFDELLKQALQKYCDADGRIKSIYKPIDSLPEDQELILRQQLIRGFVEGQMRKVHKGELSSIPSEIYEESIKAQLWKDKINHYEIETEVISAGKPVIVGKDKNGKDIYQTKIETPEESEQRVAKLLGHNEKALEALYKGCAEQETTVARDRFMAHMAKLKAEHNWDEDPPKNRKKLIELLGEDGVKYYKEALKEENNSRRFREAVLLLSTNRYYGPKWVKRLVLWIGGPSASGKSFSAEKLIEMISKVMPKRKSKQGVDEWNDVVSIDGGVERSASQVRQRVLQYAFNAGYSGCSDLEDESDVGSKVKKRIHKAADAAQLNMVIPATFTNDPTLHTKATSHFSLGKTYKKMVKYAKDRNVFQYYSNVTCAPQDKARFKKSVAQQGNSRAWLWTSKKNKIDQRPNNRKLPAESKEYEGSHFDAGYDCSLNAESVFKDVSKQHAGEARIISVLHESVFVTRDAQQTWMMCDEDITDALRINVHAYEAWCAIKKSGDDNNTPYPDLDKWWFQHQHEFPFKADITHHRAKGRAASAVARVIPGLPFFSRKRKQPTSDDTFQSLTDDEIVAPPSGITGWWQRVSDRMIGREEQIVETHSIIGEAQGHAINDTHDDQHPPTTNHNSKGGITAAAPVRVNTNSASPTTSQRSVTGSIFNSRLDDTDKRAAAIAANYAKPFKANNDTFTAIIKDTNPHEIEVYRKIKPSEKVTIIHENLDHGKFDISHQDFVGSAKDYDEIAKLEIDRFTAVMGAGATVYIRAGNTNEMAASYARVCIAMGISCIDQNATRHAELKILKDEKNVVDNKCQRINSAPDMTATQFEQLSQTNKQQTLRTLKMELDSLTALVEKQRYNPNLIKAHDKLTTQYAAFNNVLSKPSDHVVQQSSHSI